MAAPWVETCRLRGGDIILRSPFRHGGAKSDVPSFSQACREKLRKKIITGLPAPDYSA